MESIDLVYARDLHPRERRRIREDARVSRSAFARDLGCAEITVVRYENGNSEPIGRLGAAYGRLLRALAER